LHVAERHAERDAADELVSDEGAKQKCRDVQFLRGKEIWSSRVHEEGCRQGIKKQEMPAKHEGTAQRPIRGARMIG